MNTVFCDKNCKHQKDGYCNISYSQSITNSNNDDCPYFCNKNDNDKVVPKNSILEDIKKIT